VCEIRLPRGSLRTDNEAKKTGEKLIKYYSSDRIMEDEMAGV
jgi:hypothetical protein